MKFKYLAKMLYQFLFGLSHRDIVIEPKVEFGRNCRFEGANKLSRGAFLSDASLGYGSYVGYDCNLTSVRIGRYCSIGSFVRTYIGKHPVDQYVSTHPAFYAMNHPCRVSYVTKQKFTETEYAYEDDQCKYSVNIGNDVWIGNGACLMDGITIGDGAIIGANTLVMKDVAPYSIVVGSPGREIRKRFTKEEIDNLLKIKWWDKDLQWIKEHAEYFEDIHVFFDRAEQWCNDENKMQ